MIYKINCPDRGSVYVSETTGRLLDRVNEHNMESFGSQKEVLFQHLDANKSQLA